MTKPAYTLAMLAFASILASACQYAQTGRAPVAAPAPAPVTTPVMSSDPASETAPIPALVQGVCGDCHGVQPPFLSPNQNAPAFDAIANEQGLTRTTLAKWLVDAHNYPELMEFELNIDEAQVVADYMVTLQSDNYRPAQ